MTTGHRDTPERTGTTAASPVSSAARRADEPPQVSVIVPTLDEAENVDPLLAALTRAFAPEPYGFEILVADGGSTDGTRARVRAWSGEHPVRLVACSGARGLAGDVVEAAREARGTVVVVLDADLSHPPRLAPELARKVLANVADLAIGSRYCPGGATPGWPLGRRLVSRGAGSLVRLLQDAHDPLSGFLAVRRERLLELGADARGFKLGLELLGRGGEDLRVAEVPIEFRDRVRGSSKMGPDQAAAFLGRLFRLLGGGFALRAPFRFGSVVALGLALDVSCFRTLFARGGDLAAAHLAGFAAATVFNGLALALWAVPRSVVLGWRVLARFALVALMALAVRGGVLALLVRAGWRPDAALVAAILPATLVTYLGQAFYVLGATGPRASAGLRWRAAVLGLCVYLLLLRLLYLGLPTLLVEEAYYWNYSQHPSLSYLDHPPMVAVLIRAGTLLFGNTEFAVRLPAVLCGIVWVYFGYRLTLDLFGRAAAVRALLILSALPFLFVYGFFMTPDSPLIACWAGALFFLQRAILGGKRAAWYGAGVFLGLGLLSKYTIILLVPATFLLLLLERESRAWLARKEPYVALALALAIFSPVLVWNAAHDWASFVFQGPHRLASGSGFGLPRLLLAILLLLSPTVLLAAAHALRASGAGARARTRTFALAYLAVPLSAFALFSVSHADLKANWTGPIWLAVLPAIALFLTQESAGESRGRRWAVRALAPTFCVLVAVYGLGLQYLTFGAPARAYPDWPLFGWEHLADQVETLEDELERELGTEPLVVGLDKYNIASQLAFYRSKLRPNEREGVLETTGRQLFGLESLMYGYWPLTSPPEGRTMILVADEPTDLARRSVQGRFEHVSEPRAVRTSQNGKDSPTFYLSVGYGFHEASPE